MSEEIMVSVNCLVYNHEKYLRKCLDGFVMQKTNFKFEVLIHDDASTDCSQEIIREYEEKYPDIIKPIYQTENQHSKRIGISRTFIYPKLKGKYIAFCEGDDYWFDENKLQKQFDIMEANPDCSICVHKVKNIYEDGRDIGSFIPCFKLKTGKISSEDFFSYIYSKGYPFQTSSYFIRREVEQILCVERPDFVKAFKVGDEPRMLIAAHLGNYYYIDETMSAYRRSSLGSWSSRVASNKDNWAVNILAYKNAIELFDEYSDFKYSKYLKSIKLYNEFSCYVYNKDYRSCFKLKYFIPFHKSSFKSKIYIFLGAFSPKTLKIIENNRSK